MTVTKAAREGEQTGLLDGKDRGQCGWGESAMVIIASMLGTGILGLPLALNQTGWSLGLVWMTIMLAMSLYSGLLLGKLHLVGGNAKTYTELADEVVSNRFGRRMGVLARTMVMFIAYSYLFGVCCIFVTAMKISLRELMFQARLSETAWLLVTMVFIFPFVQMQSLHEASFITTLGVLTILLVNGVVVYQVLKILLGSNVYETVVTPLSQMMDSTVNKVNGLTAIAFAFGGHVIFLEVLSEMKHPSEFPKSIYASQATMYLNYLAVGILGLAAYGSNVQSPITVNLPASAGLSMLAHLCLLVHVLVAYCIESYVIVLAVDKYLNAKFANLPGILSSRAPRIRWAILSGSVLLAAGFVSLLIPSFGDLMSLYSSIGIFSLSFAVPPLLWVIFNFENMSRFSVAAHVLLVLFSAVFGLLGLSASAQTIFSQLRLRMAF